MSELATYLHSHVSTTDLAEVRSLGVHLLQ
jgi:hypothetical protein